MRTILFNGIQDCIRAIEQLKSPDAVFFMEQAAVRIVNCFREGGKVIIAGNGGSLCDAAHFAEELTGFFRQKRPALPAIVLNDPGHITCTANDIGFDSIFSRGVEALGQPGDVFVALTTSGQSQNLLKAVETAKKRGLQTITFLGKQGGRLKGKADLEWIVQGFSTSDRIQEAHMAALHLIIELIEYQMFPPAAESSVENPSVMQANL